MTKYMFCLAVSERGQGWQQWVNHPHECMPEECDALLKQFIANVQSAGYLVHDAICRLPFEGE